MVLRADLFLDACCYMGYKHRQLFLRIRRGRFDVTKNCSNLPALQWLFRNQVDDASGQWLVSCLQP
jgi:hypothetical protein